MCVRIHQTAFEPSKTLPRACIGNQIFFKHRQTHTQRPACAIRTQAHVDTKHKTKLRDIIEQFNDPFTQPFKKLPMRQQAWTWVVAGVLCLTIVFKHKNQIHVRRDIQLIARQFTHAHHPQRHRRAILAQRFTVYFT